MYSSKIAWLREYIQNSIDSDSTKITISFKGRDLEISDNGLGIDEESLKEKIFSPGYSEKKESQIGELGIGIYAGLWICDKVIIYTQQKNSPCYKAEFDSKKYNEILSIKPDTLFEDGISEICSLPVQSSYPSNSNYNSFTSIFFENISDEVLKLLDKKSIKEFVRDNISIPISQSFPCKQKVVDFLKDDNKPISVELKYNGGSEQIEKFDNLNGVDLYEPIFFEVKGNDNKNIAKIWACYNKAGKAFKSNSFFIKFKGMTVGDKTTISAKINEKFSSAKSRFIGEIIVADFNLKILTERNWFVESPELNNLIAGVKKEIAELYNLASDDSSLGVGFKKKIADLNKIDEQIKLETNNKNQGLVEKLRLTKARSEETISKKEKELTAKINKLKNKDQLNQLEKIRLQLFESTKKSLSKKIGIADNKDTKKERKSPIPEILKTLITERIIDSRFKEHVLGKNLKDTTNNVFTIIETALKEKLGYKENIKKNISDLVSNFLRKFEPSDDDKKKYTDSADLYSDTKNFLSFIHRYFRNPAAHTILDDIDTDRNIIRVLIIGDFALQLINSWVEKK
ncbi:MAG: ATP-binding protein [bacterium]